MMLGALPWFGVKLENCDDWLYSIEDLLKNLVRQCPLMIEGSKKLSTKDSLVNLVQAFVVV